MSEPAPRRGFLPRPALFSSSRTPLRYSLALGFGLFAAALTSVLSVVVESFASKQIVAAIEAQLENASSQMRDKLDRGMFERWRDVQIAASLVEVFDPAAPKQAQRAWLERLQTTFPAYAWIGFTDASGKVAAATGGLLEGVDVSSRPWFRNAQKAPAAVDVHDAKLLQKLLAPAATEPLRFVDVASPVFGAGGKLNGVLGAHLSWSWAEEVRASVLAESRRSDGVELLIYAQDGKLVLGPAIAAPPTIQITGQGADLAPLEYGHLVRASLSRGYQSYPGLGWWVVARQPTIAALAPVTAFRERLILVGGIVTLGFMVIGWFAAQGVARPLERLANAAHRLRDGSGEPLPRLGGYREIAVLGRTLAHAFAGLVEGKAQLERLNAGLERQVEQRTRDLAAARDEAQAATRAKSDFLATMSHELRTPLHGVAGAAQLLRDEGELSPKQARRLTLIETASASLLKVIGDVLDFSKLEAGKLEIEAAPFEPARLVDASIQIVQPTAEAKGLTLRAEIAGDTPARLVGDEGRLRQIMLNLLNNAVKFTSAGTIVLTVETVGHCGDGVRLRFSVADQGIGMTAEVRDRVFGRFEQADAATNRKFGGSGLGLAISKHLVETMGGRIEVESEPGRGSTFWFELVLPEAAQEVRADGPVATDAGSFKRILLAEDLDINQEIATAFLAAAGHIVETVADGAQAVAAVRDGRFDLVLMDIQMPVMDGVAALRAIRALPGAASHLPVIAMTANVLAEQLERFAEAGFDGHVGKPFRREELLKAVALGERRIAA